VPEALRGFAGVGGVVARNLEELVQPRGAVDGDSLALQIPVAGLGRVQELVELGTILKEESIHS
jgi:hypothetical protein